MLSVFYKAEEVGGDFTTDYGSPIITAQFDCNGMLVTFCPEKLAPSGEWKALVSAIDNNTQYHIISSKTGKEHYELVYNDSVLGLLIGAFSTGTVGSLSVEIPMNKHVKQTLIELGKLAKCAEDGVEYERKIMFSQIIDEYVDLQ